MKASYYFALLTLLPTTRNFLRAEYTGNMLVSPGKSTEITIITFYQNTKAVCVILPVPSVSA